MPAPEQFTLPFEATVPRPAGDDTKTPDTLSEPAPQPQDIPEPLAWETEAFKNHLATLDTTITGNAISYTEMFAMLSAKRRQIIAQYLHSASSLKSAIKGAYEKMIANEKYGITSEKTIPTHTPSPRTSISKKNAHSERR